MLRFKITSFGCFNNFFTLLQNMYIYIYIYIIYTYIHHIYIYLHHIYIYIYIHQSIRKNRKQIHTKLKILRKYRKYGSEIYIL